MNLEQALRELEVDWPATPDLATAVRARIVASEAPLGGERAVRPSRPGDEGPSLPRGEGVPGPSRPGERRPASRGARRRRAAAVLAAVLVGGVLAVPDARSTVLRWLGIESVEVRRGEPSATPGAALDLGRPSTIDRLGVPVLQARDLGTPRVYATTLPDGTRAASLVYAGPVLVQTFRAQASPFIEKTVGMGAAVERLAVAGAPAFWITGAHGFAYESPSGFGFEQQRIAGNTLLVERADGLLLRIEGVRTRERAVAIGRSVQ